jgi:CO/xanthine dehydrogenase Mo-binding subunit
VLAANPCPCGNSVGKGLACACTPNQRRRYFGKLSGPLLDRVDLQVDVTPAHSSDRPGESTAVVAARVRQARAAAAYRLAGTGWSTNAEVPGGWLRDRLGPGRRLVRKLDESVDRGTLSLRGVDRVLRVAWTLADLAGRVYAGDILIDDTTAPDAGGRIKLHTTFGFATQVVVLDAEGKLDRVVAAHDVGRAINPQLCEGQIEGAVAMGLGYALTEELPCRAGMPVPMKMREIGALRAGNMPQVEVILVEEHEPEGPFGAKGVGEIGLVPTAGAVAAALHDLDGEWRARLPMRAG